MERNSWLVLTSNCFIKKEFNQNSLTHISIKNKQKKQHSKQECTWSIKIRILNFDISYRSSGQGLTCHCTCQSICDSLLLSNCFIWIRILLSQRLNQILHDVENKTDNKPKPPLDDWGETMPLQCLWFV